MQRQRNSKLYKECVVWNNHYLSRTAVHIGQVGDYLLPNLTLSEEEQKPIGIWGQRHLRYLKQYRKVLYTNLLTSGKLNSHLAEIDEQATDMFFRLVKEMADKQGVTEQLKSDNQMAWVGKMNNIRNRAIEIVNHQIIFT